jgi:dTDP-4-dehydrorhamnose reductase
MAMTVLVAGAAGQVGRELVRRSAGRRLVATSRAEMDITDAAQVMRLISAVRPSVVVNAAAYTAVDRAQREPHLARAVNAQGAGNLAIACAREGVPLLHLSTDYVFDGSGDQPWHVGDRAQPLCSYGITKLEGEQQVRAHLRAHIVMRVSWVFGAHGHNFVNTMLRLGAERSLLRVVDDQIGCPTFAGAIADALLELCDRIELGAELPWGTFHYTGSPAVSWCAFARTIFDEAVDMGLMPNAPRVEGISSAEYPTEAQRPLYSVLDTGRTQRRLGVATRPWREGLREVLAQRMVHA